MPIDMNNINNLQARTAGKPATEKSEAVTTPSTRSEGQSNTETVDQSVQLSDRAKNMQRVTQELERVPVVDTSRVESIRQKLASGTYMVDSTQVAEKMMSQESFQTKTDSEGS